MTLAERSYDEATASAVSPSAWHAPRTDGESASALLQTLHPVRGLGRGTNFATIAGGKLAPRPVVEPPEWLAFLDALTGPEAGLAAGHAKRVRQVWGELRGAVGSRLPLPQAERVEGDAICLSWSSDSIYAEIEVRADGKHAWFVRDHAADRHDGSNGAEAGAPPRRFLQFLQSAFHESR